MAKTLWQERVTALFLTVTFVVLLWPLHYRVDALIDSYFIGSKLIDSNVNLGQKVSIILWVLLIVFAWICTKQCKVVLKELGRLWSFWAFRLLVAILFLVEFEVAATTGWSVQIPLIANNWIQDGPYFFLPIIWLLFLLIEGFSKIFFPREFK